jgi:integrase
MVAFPMSIPRLVKNPHTDIYEVRFAQDGRSRVRSLGTRDYDEAMQAFGKWCTLSKQAAVDKADPTLDMVIADYMREHVETRVVAQERQEQCALPLIAMFGKVKPRDIGMAETLKYSNLRQAGRCGANAVAESTVRREIGMLRAAINHGIKAGRLTSDSLRHMFIPRQPAPKDLYLTKEQLQVALDTAKDCGERTYLFVMIAAYTAARKGSIEHLTWDRVDFANGMINFDDGSIRTKKRKVKVPMNKALFDALKERYCSPQPTSEFVTGNNTPMHREFLRLKVLLKERHPQYSDKWEAMTPHTLRHTWATLAAQSGVSMFDIAGVLGDTVQTVIRVYAHHSPNHLRQAVSFL